jgi:nucleoside-diphosphate-sugar epimerase
MGKYTRVTTPKGQASYPWLKQPDTKFNPDGLYSCNILVDKSDATKLIEEVGWEPEYKIEDTLNDLLNYWIKKINT